MIGMDCVRDVLHNQTSPLTRDLLCRFLSEPNTRMAIEQVRSHGNAAAKRWLPGICWQATFRPAYRKEQHAQPNGVFALDVDHIGYEGVDALWRRTEPRIDELDILCFHRSPSGDGARVVALCQEGFQTIAENQAWLAARLETPYDAACHDLARLFFVSVEEDFYYVDWETMFSS